MIKLSEQFRTNTDDYFKLSGIREYKKLAHTPFIVLIPRDDCEDWIEVVDNAKDLVENYKPYMWVIAQWRGNWHSDFFKFRISDLIKYCKENPKKDHQII